MAHRTPKQNVEMSRLLCEFHKKMADANFTTLDLLDAGITILTQVIINAPPAIRERLRELVDERLDFAVKRTCEVRDAMQDAPERTQ